MRLLVRHLLEPRLPHISLRCHLLVLQLIIFCLLDRQSVVQSLVIQISLNVPLLVGRLVLVLQLIPQAVVLPVDLRLFGVAHLLDDLLSFLGAEVRLVVLLVVVLVIGTLLPGPVHLKVDELLVLLLVDASLGLCFPELVLLVLDRVDKLGFFSLTKLLKSDELVLVAVQGLHSGLVNDSRGFVGRVLIDVSQGVVVHGEGTFRSQEDGHVGVVGR